MKQTAAWAWGGASVAGAVLAAGLLATRPVTAAGPGNLAEDDLAVVKRAVAQSAPAVPEQPAARAEREEPRNPAARPARTAGKEPTWLKVRVTDKGTGRKKVTVNVPLALVRALDDGFPIDFGCGREHRRCSIRIGEVLDALEAGQDLVEVDDENELVRVWVE
jgi:hypothetical protein